jgi:hypothetical protein
MNQGFSAAQSYTDQRYASAITYTDAQMHVARQYAARGIAASAALPNVAPSEPGRTAVGFGTGYTDGQTAVGLAVSHAFNEHFTMAGAMAKVSGGESVARVTAGFEF